MSSTVVWQKSSYSSGGEPENCIEVGRSAAVIVLRESSAPCAVLVTTTHRLGDLIRIVKVGAVFRL